MLNCSHQPSEELYWSVDLYNDMYNCVYRVGCSALIERSISHQDEVSNKILVTDRPTDTFLSQYSGGCVYFFLMRFATCLLALLPGG